MNITIIGGAGYVGLPTAAGFAEKGHNVTVVDCNEEKIKMLKGGKVPIFEPGLEKLLTKNSERLTYTTSTKQGVNNSEIIFISVPTPFSEKDRKSDLSFVEKVSREIAEHLDDKLKLIVEKSTVPVNTGNRVESTIQRYSPIGAKFVVISNPEFLQEGLALDGVLTPSRIEVGINHGPYYNVAKEMMMRIYDGFNSPILFHNRASAEAVKLASNVNLLMQISLINKIALICRESGANIEEVSQGMSLDPRIGRFNKAGIGFGGSCFGKDGWAMLSVAEQYGLPFDMLKEALEFNESLRDIVAREISNHFMGGLRDKIISVLGLSFKPETDDIRDSPSIGIVKRLLNMGAEKIRVCDPEAISNAKKELAGREYAGKIYYTEEPYDATTGANVILLATEWNQFRELDMGRIKNSCVNGVFLFDGRSVFNPEEMMKLGYTYTRIDKKPMHL